MNPIIFALAALVWCFAAFAFVRIAIAWFSLIRLAPRGQKFDAALELGFWNFGAVERRIGPAAVPAIKKYRSGFYLFLGAIVPFIALTVVNIIVSGPGSQA